MPGRKHDLVFTDRVLVALVHLRTGLPNAALAEPYGTARSTVSRAIGEVERVRPHPNATQSNAHTIRKRRIRRSQLSGAPARGWSPTSSPTDLRSPAAVIAGGDRVCLVPRRWCRAQANSSTSISGPMAMGAGR
ncbi:transposase family protein [Kitasatospora sp. NBC_00374]